MLLQLTKLKLEVLKSDFQHKKEMYKSDKLAINSQNFARVRLQLKFTFIMRPRLIALQENVYYLTLGF